MPILAWNLLKILLILRRLGFKDGRREHYVQVMNAVIWTKEERQFEGIKHI